MDQAGPRQGREADWTGPERERMEREASFGVTERWTQCRCITENQWRVGGRHTWRGQCIHVATLRACEWRPWGHWGGENPKNRAAHVSKSQPRARARRAGGCTHVGRTWAHRMSYPFARRLNAPRCRTALEFERRQSSGSRLPVEKSSSGAMALEKGCIGVRGCAHGRRSYSCTTVLAARTIGSGLQAAVEDHCVGAPSRRPRAVAILRSGRLRSRVLRTMCPCGRGLRSWPRPLRNYAE